jgi:hypothetical protein
MDSFTIAVLVGGGALISILGLALILDKGKRPAAAAAPVKSEKR